jgi:hypothetical protein
MLKWLVNNGATLFNTHIIGLNDSERGVVASKTIKKGSRVASIPRKCMITLGDGLKTKSGKILKLNGINNHTILAVLLLEEKEDVESFFTPYIRYLPTNFSHIPLFYDQDAIDTLPDFSRLMLESRIAQMREDYETIAKLIPITYTFHQFVWGRTVVITRIFGFKENVSSFEDSALVPFVDLLNHDKKPNTYWGFKDGQFFLGSSTWIFKGCSLLDSYGSKCNSRYFVNYGFILEGNEKNNQGVIFMPNIGNNSLNIDDSYSGYDYLIKNNFEKKVSSGDFVRFQVPNISMLDVFEKGGKKIKKHREVEKLLDYARGGKTFNLENEVAAIKKISDAILFSHSSLVEFRNTLEKSENDVLLSYVNLWKLLASKKSPKHEMSWYFRKYYLPLINVSMD